MQALARLHRVCWRGLACGTDRRWTAPCFSARTPRPSPQSEVPTNEWLRKWLNEPGLGGWGAGRPRDKTNLNCPSYYRRGDQRGGKTGSTVLQSEIFRLGLASIHAVSRFQQALRPFGAVYCDRLSSVDRYGPRAHAGPLNDNIVAARDTVAQLLPAAASAAAAN
jgi:hypothetical protein